jgi:hypothetical protein
MGKIRLKAGASFFVPLHHNIRLQNISGFYLPPF